AERKVPDRQLALYTLAELAHLRFRLAEIDQLIDVHLEINAAGDAFQILDAQEGAEETELQIGGYLHPNLWVDKIMDRETTFEDALSGPGIHILHPQNRGLKRVAVAVGIVTGKGKRIQ